MKGYLCADVVALNSSAREREKVHTDGPKWVCWQVWNIEEQEAKMLTVSIKILNVSMREMEPGRPSKVEIKQGL